MALAIRSPIGRASVVETALPYSCTRYVTMLEAAARQTNGTFSKASPFRVECCRLKVESWKRCKGQTSNRSNTKGSVTSMGLLISPQAKKNNASEYQNFRS